MPELPPEAYETVRRNWRATAGYVIARTGDCLEVQEQETWGPRGRVRGRRFAPIPPTELARLSLPVSWFAGIILCPGDPLEEIVEWAKGLSTADLERIILYLHPGFDESAAKRTWAAAGLRDPKTVRFDGSWGNFHHLFGNHHAWRVFLDHPP